MSSSVIDLYDKLRTAPDDEARARIIAGAFETLEERYPHLADMATRTHLSETELRLIREIEQVRADLSKEIAQVRADLSKEIEQVRADLSKEIEQVRADLSKEIEQVRADLSREIEQLRGEFKVELAQNHTTLLKWSFLFWMTQFGAIMLLLWRIWPGQ